MRPKTTVYIPCHDYGRFLPEAVESVLEQTVDDWELVIVCDGAVDDTETIAADYAARHPERIRSIAHTPARGLQACANIALREARGKYVMRLDADDYLDESALLVLAGYLDRHPDVALVYPNYTYVNAEGDYLGQERRKRVGEEALLLDLPAHGACTMVRKRVLKSVGGYSEKFDAQDGYELWLKVLNRYQVAHVGTPLFFYRQHRASVSRDEGRVLEARRRIKRDLIERQRGEVRPRIVALIPAKNTYQHLQNVVLEPLAGRPLLDYSLAAAGEVEGIDRIVVATDDEAVLDHCSELDGIFTVPRPPALSDPAVALSRVVEHSVKALEEQHRFFADIVVVLSVHSPLRRAIHIQKALDTLLLYNTDSVISVYEDFDLHFLHGKHGLEALNAAMMSQIRLEREALFVDNGAVRAMWREVITEEGMLGTKIGHSVMRYEDSLQIKTEFDRWLAEQILARRAAIVDHG
jgi:glycosyltransferase involved in cell wall biosynthesis